MWHISIASSIVYYGTNSIPLAIVANTIAAILNLKLADWAYPILTKTYPDKTNCINSHINSLSMLPIAAIINWTLDNFLKAVVLPSSKKFKILNKLSQPMEISLTIGIFIGIFARLEPIDTLKFSLGITAVFMLLPKIFLFYAAGFYENLNFI